MPGTTLNNLHFENCIANSNEANSSSGTCDNAAGFYLADLANSKLVNCQAHKNNSEDLGGYGFYLDQPNSGNFNNILDGCRANGNIAEAADQNAVGFYSTSGTNNRFINCTANGNACSTAASAVSVGRGAAGFKIDSATRTEIDNCEAVGNTVPSHATSRAYGFYLGATASSCVIKDSFAAYNTAYHLL